MGYTGCPKNTDSTLYVCAGRQTDYFSRRNPCPESHGLDAVEHRRVRYTCRDVNKPSMCMSGSPGDVGEATEGL